MFATIYYTTQSQAVSVACPSGMPIALTKRNILLHKSLAPELTQIPTANYSLKPTNLGHIGLTYTILKVPGNGEHHHANHPIHSGFT